MAGEENTVDVAIIGGGAAGMSAALWCDDLGLDAVLIEQEAALGGQLHRIYNPIENYLGVGAANGLEMLSKFEKSIASRNFVRRTGIKAMSIDVERMAVLLVDGQDVSTKTIILATGVRRRTLGIPGERDFRGKGILESGARDRSLVSGKRVLIVGGGDAAFENALMLSESAASVHVAYRRAEPSARQEFIEAAGARDNIRLQSETILLKISGDSAVERVELRGPNGRDWFESVDAVLIRVGVEPNSELAGGVLNLDEFGYIEVDDAGQTNVANVYAVGDVSHRYSPTLSTAAGTAATAVKTIFHSIGNSKEL